MTKITIDSETVQQATDALIPLGNAHSPQERDCITDADVAITNLTAALQQAEPQAQEAAVDFLPHDDILRFVQRVLESDAPKSDRADAAKMVGQLRMSIRPAMAAMQVEIDRLENELKDASVAAIAEAVHVDELIAKLKVLTVDAERYRWLAKEHGWRLLKHFHAVRPYVDASEVIDESIDAAMWRNA